MTNNESNPPDNEQPIYPSLSLFLHPSISEQVFTAAAHTENLSITIGDQRGFLLIQELRVRLYAM